MCFQKSSPDTKSTESSEQIMNHGLTEVTAITLKIPQTDRSQDRINRTMDDPEATGQWFFMKNLKKFFHTAGDHREDPYVILNEYLMQYRV